MTGRGGDYHPSMGGRGMYTRGGRGYRGGAGGGSYQT